jgi:hypothetical protein
MRFVILFCILFFRFLHGVVSGVAFSCMGKYDDFIVFIKTSKAAYAKEVLITWDPKHENHNPSKAC